MAAKFLYLLSTIKSKLFYRLLPPARLARKYSDFCHLSLNFEIFAEHLGGGAMILLHLFLKFNIPELELIIT